MDRPPGKGRALKSGDRVRVIAPSSRFSRDAFEGGIRKLAAWGLTPVYRDDIFDEDRHLAGVDARRVDELREALADPDARAVFCVRGGGGVMRLFAAGVDDVLGAARAPIVGFSDNSALIWRAFALGGAPGIHAPMIAGRTFREAGEAADAWFRRLLFDASAPGLVPGFNARTVVSGRASGVLAPINLTMLIHLLAADMFALRAPVILVLEDVFEPPYRVDRMMATLVSRGALDNVAGIALGDFGDRHRDEIDDILAEWCLRIGLPSVAGAPVGHGAINLPLPVGVAATLDADAGTLTIHESPLC
ncbi:LD-carboxypeptidase [bacterium]|nr:LD-carboxypeptidase [bacterium]